MAKPLRSDDPNPTNVQFRHFGVMDTGPRSKGAAIFSISVNVALAAAIIILGMVVKNNPTMKAKVEALYLPPKPPEPPPPPKVVPPPPKPLPKPPEIKIQPPKIKMPDPVKLPPEIKPVVVPTPKPVVLAPPAPKKVDPPPAPKIVSFAKAAPAAIANNDAHPSAVRLGNPEIKALTGPPVATAVNLGGGMHGMPPGNTGSGPHASSVNFGNGAPGGTNLNGKDRAPAKIAGFSNGVPGGTGTGRSGPVAVQIAAPAAVVAPQVQQAAIRTKANPPVLTYKPQALYTEEARAARIEGTVQVHIKVTTSGQAIFLGITKGLGHGLDQSAQTVVNGMKFKPATDAAGNPIDDVIDVLVRFQLS